MVKLAVFVLMTLSLFLKAESLFTLTTELSKEKVYQGESFTVTFFLESSEDRIVEVEVMKFPEFRGFWSENILLRQGPLHVMSLGKKKGQSRAAVGSYNVQSILGTSSPSIEPMKILVRTQDSSPLSLESSPAPLVLLPLPFIPVPLSPFSFVGAVGNFRLAFERTQIPYRAGQPFLIRGELSGEGNFSEISSLPLELPPSVKLISEQVFSDSQYGRSRKVFEWSLETQEKVLEDWNPGKVLYFDPVKRAYQPLAFPSFSFVLLPEVILPESVLPKVSVEFSLEPHWTESRPWFLRTPFLVGQILLALLLIAVTIWVQVRLQFDERNQNPKILRKRQKKQAQQAFADQNWSLFFPLAISLAQTLSKTDPSLKESLQLLIQAEGELRFSPEKKLFLSPESLQGAWHRIHRNL